MLWATSTWLPCISESLFLFSYSFFLCSCLKRLRVFSLHRLTPSFAVLSSRPCPRQLAHSCFHSFLSLLSPSILLIIPFSILQKRLLLALASLLLLLSDFLRWASGSAASFPHLPFLLDPEIWPLPSPCLCNCSWEVQLPVARTSPSSDFVAPVPWAMLASGCPLPWVFADRQASGSSSKMPWSLSSRAPSSSSTHHWNEAVLQVLDCLSSLLLTWWYPLSLVCSNTNSQLSEHGSQVSILNPSLPCPTLLSVCFWFIHQGLGRKVPSKVPFVPDPPTVVSCTNALWWPSLETWKSVFLYT